MTKTLKIPLIVGLVFGLSSGMAIAQSAGDKGAAAPTSKEAKREANKADRAEFLRTHRYDSNLDAWVLKPGVEAPGAKKTKEQRKAEREEFLKTHRYNAQTESWVPVKAGEPSKMTKEQSRAQAQAFNRTHELDPDTEMWVEKKAKK